MRSLSTKRGPSFAALFRIDEQKAKIAAAMVAFESEVPNPLAEEESVDTFESEGGQKR